MISTKHKHEMQEIVGKLGNKINKSACELDYNKHISGIGQGLPDAVIIPRKTLRWYRHFFSHLLDICIWNEYYIYRNNTGNNIYFLRFREMIIDDLIGSVSVRQTIKLKRIHRIPTTYNNKNGILQCRHCSKQKIGRRSPGICVDPCFKNWHRK